MTEKPYSDIDELFSSWSAEHEPSPDHLEALSAKVDESLRAERSANKHVVLHDHWYASRSVALTAAAVILMVACAGVWIALQNQNGAKRLASPPYADPIDAISDGQRIQKQSLLAELDRMFEGKRVWFAETESEVVLGGESRPTASDIAAESTVAMRLVLAKRSAASQAWQRVWSADVVSRTDQVVQFISQEPEQPNATFTTWAHLLPDGLVACDVDLKWNDGKPGQLSDSLLLSPGDTEMGTSLNVDGVEYRLFHAVSLLEMSTT